MDRSAIVVPLLLLSACGFAVDGDRALQSDHALQAPVADFGLGAPEIHPCPEDWGAPLPIEVLRGTDEAPRGLPVYSLREGELIVVTPERDAVWHGYVDAAEPSWSSWEHAFLVGHGGPTGILPFTDDQSPRDFGFAVVSGGRAHPDARPNGVCGEGLPLERAPAAELVFGEPGLSDEEALKQTVVMRLMKTCPGSRERCMLFGPPQDVQAAVDPADPPGGWNLFAVEVPPIPADAVFDPVALVGDHHPLLAASVATFENGDGESSDVVAFDLVRGGVRVPAYDLYFDGYGVELDWSTSGVHTEGERLVAWTWFPEQLRLAVSVHDATTLERLESHVVEGDPYFEVVCGNIFSGTTPVPAFDEDGDLGFVLDVGSDEAIFFDTPGEHGRVVRVAEPAHLSESYDDQPSRMRVAHLVDGVLH